MSNSLNPLHILRKGIQLSNWPMVKEAFEELTGEPAPEQWAVATPGEIVSQVEPPTEEFLKAADAEVPITASTPAHRVNIDDFRVHNEPSRQRSEGGRYARLEPVQPMKNEFRDNLIEAREEMKFDQMLIEKGVRPAHRAVENRASPAMVTVTCRLCDQQKQVSASEAPPRRLSKDDQDGSGYVCDNCISEKAKGRRNRD